MTLDAIDAKILAELQADGRLPFAELARRIGLSTPATIERVRQLEDAQVILRYTAAIDPAKVGLPIHAFIKITVDGNRLQHFQTVARAVPEVLTCHRVTGSESYILEVAARDLAHLEAVIDSLNPYVATNTSLVLASPVPWKPVPTALPAPPARETRRRPSSRS